ncbi:MAG: diadenylate cyclase CdaA [Ruminococcus sp.]|nr:diadenylate cyclase CdaA [Ruminococcus sp.]
MGAIKEWLSGMLAVLKTFQLNDLFDIFIVAIIIYSLFKILHQTRAAQLVKGIFLLAIAFVLSNFFGLSMVNFVLTTIFEYAVIILVIVFQPELRLALEHLGRSNISKRGWLSILSSTDDEYTRSWQKAIEDIADAAVIFSRSKTGALIVVERNTLLTEISASGTELNSDTSVALFGNIFFNKAPLHDGACIIRDGKILSAGCILPLSDNYRLNSSLGTRHRAAIGMSEESDAAVLVVSEETGLVSLAVGGKLIRNLGKEEIIEELTDLVLPQELDKKDLFASFKKGRKEKKNEKE